MRAQDELLLNRAIIAIITSLPCLGIHFGFIWLD
jgi:hypothetical protein